MNTRIYYLYRDASGYKSVPDKRVIVKGRLNEELLREALSGDRFLPSQLGLPELQNQLTNYPTSDDHIWHRLEKLEYTKESPTVNVTSEEVEELLRKIINEGWDKGAAIAKLEKAAFRNRSK